MNKPPIPPDTVLTAIFTHSDQAFTKKDFVRDIARQQPPLGAAPQPKIVIDTLYSRGRGVHPVQDNTNSRQALDRLTAHDEALLIERQLRTYRPRLPTNTRQCSCGVPILYGSMHLNCPLEGNTL